LASGELAEVFVERQQNALLAYRPCKHIQIGRTWPCDPNPNDVVPRCLKSDNG